MTLVIAWRTTKLIKGGHRGLQAYRPICYYFYVFYVFYVFFKIQKKRDFLRFFCRVSYVFSQGLKKPLFCVPTDELLQAKDDLLSEGGQSMSSLTEQVVRQSLQLHFQTWPVLVKRVLNLLLQSSTRMQNLGLGLHQNAFGGRDPPGPAGGAKALPQTP